MSLKQFTIEDRHTPCDRLIFARGDVPNRAAASIYTRNDLGEGPDVRLQAEDCIRLARALLKAAEVQNDYREAIR
jgi:hypothetical protein